MFYNKDKNTNRLNALAQALNSTKNGNNTFQITAFQPVRSEENQNSGNNTGNLNQLISGGMKLYKGLNNSGLFGGDSNAGTNDAISSSINNNVFGSGESLSPISSAINSNVMGSGDNSSLLSGAINSEVSSGSGGGLGSSMPWGAIGSAAKGLYNNISGHNDKDYSDTEESIIYPLQGASKGAAFGPWGAAAGALYGLGYSFKDDMGLKDSNFLTQMLYPLGMGDGGGLRIGGKSVLDIL